MKETTSRGKIGGVLPSAWIHLLAGSLACRED